MECTSVSYVNSIKYFNVAVFLMKLCNIGSVALKEAY